MAADCLAKKLCDVLCDHIANDADTCIKSSSHSGHELTVNCVDKDGISKEYSVCVKEVGASNDGGCCRKDGDDCGG